MPRISSVPRIVGDLFRAIRSANEITGETDKSIPMMHCKQFNKNNESLKLKYYANRNM